MITTILSMSIFSFVMSFSPGPVNLISLSIGLNQGFKTALPFVSGATIGFTILLFCLGLGLGSFTQQFPVIMNLLSIVGATFIMYMGYKMTGSKSALKLEEGDFPTFLDGVLLQLLNPKAWAACLAGVAAFGASDNFYKLSLFTTIYFVICYFGIGSWAFIGGKIFQRLNSPSGLIMFNKVMGVGLILVGLFLLLQRFFIA